MRGYPSAGAAAPATPATVEDWYAAGPTPAEQALAMAVAALPDVPVETVFAVAQLFETRLEAQLRALTEAEQATAPRAIGHSSRSERLARVAARQTTLRGAHGAPSRVVRFEDPNWRATLLEHVWTERDDVRDVFLDCIFELIEDDAYRPVGAALALSLGQIAQRHFEAVEQLVLRRWIADLGERNLYWRSRIIGSLLASAVARNENIGSVTRLLDAVVAGGGGPRGRLTYQHLLALRLGLGPLGLARPDIAIAVLKLFGRRTFFWERQMRHVAETSLSLEGPANDAPALETDPEADPDAAAVDSDPETPEAAEASDKGDPAATEGTGEADRPAGGLDAAHAVLPAAELLAALGDWADEAAPDEPAKGLRQVPIRAVMLAIARMPVHAGSGSGRLSIADLMTVIDRREPALIDRLAKAFQRAAVATPYARSRGYLPIRHLRLVFQTLAWRRLREREAMRRVCEPLPAGPDPFLAFAARIYAAIAARHGAAAEAVIDGARRRITAEEEAAIRHPGERPGR